MAERACHSLGRRDSAFTDLYVLVTSRPVFVGLSAMAFFTLWTGHPRDIHQRLLLPGPGSVWGERAVLIRRIRVDAANSVIGKFTSTT